MYELRLHHQARSNGNRDHRATRQERALTSIDIRTNQQSFVRIIAPLARREGAASFGQFRPRSYVGRVWMKKRVD